MVMKSKVDVWLVALIWGSVLVCCLPAFLTPNIATISMAMLFFLFISFMWFRTKYVLTEEELIIKGGFVAKRVPFSAMTKISSTRNPLSAPALSMDRLEILYEPHMQMVLISPKDKEAFIAWVVARNTSIRLGQMKTDE